MRTGDLCRASLLEGLGAAGRMRGGELAWTALLAFCEALRPWPRQCSLIE